MATSEYKAIVQFSDTEMGSNNPVSVGNIRSKLINNLNHYADERAKVCIGYISAKGKSGLSASQGTDSVYADERYLLFHQMFPVNVRSDGQSYLLRVRLAGHRADGGQGNATATFEAVIGTADQMVSRPSSNTITVTTAIGSASWIAAPTWIADPATPYIVLSPDTIAKAWTDQSVTESGDGGAAHSVNGTISWAMVHAVVWGATSEISIKAILRGFRVEEYVGL